MSLISNPVTFHLQRFLFRPRRARNLPKRRGYKPSTQNVTITYLKKRIAYAAAVADSRSSCGNGSLSRAFNAK